MSLLGPNGEPAQQSTPEPAPEQPEAPEIVFAVTAFIVLQTPEGRWLVTDDLNAPIAPARKPTQDDLIAGGSNVVAEITSVKAADKAAVSTLRTMRALDALEAQQKAQQKLSPDEARALAQLGAPGVRRA